MREKERNRILNIELGKKESIEREENIEGNWRVVKSMSSMIMVWIEKDIIKKKERKKKIMRFKSELNGDEFKMRNEDEEIVERRKRMIKKEESGKIMIIGEVEELIRSGGEDDGKMRWNRRKIEKVLKIKNEEFEERWIKRIVINRSKMEIGIEKCIKKKIGKKEGKNGRRIEVNVEKYEWRNIIGWNIVIGNNMKDKRRLGNGWKGWIRKGKDIFKKKIFGNVIEENDEDNIKRRNGVKSGDILRMEGLIKKIENGFKNNIREKEENGRGKRKKRIVGDKWRGLRKWNMIDNKY